MNEMMRSSVFLLILTLSACMGKRNESTGKRDSLVTDTESSTKAKKFVKFYARPDSMLVQNEYGSVYITRDTTAPMYARLKPGLEDGGEHYSILIGQMKKAYKMKVKHLNVREPRRFNAVHLYKGQYYVYSPCDWMVNWGYLITDSLFYITRPEPYDIFMLRGYAAVGNDSYVLKGLDYTGRQKTIRIDLVDQRFKIYVLSFLNQTNQVEHRHLMQDSRYVKSLPMIVCDCGGVKCEMNVMFDDPDYEKLLAKRR